VSDCRAGGRVGGRVVPMSLHVRQKFIFVISTLIGLDSERKRETVKRFEFQPKSLQIIIIIIIIMTFIRDMIFSKLCEFSCRKCKVVGGVTLVTLQLIFLEQCSIPLDRKLANMSTHKNRLFTNIDSF
jgi:hypothetical protein